jgi:hypothetical protein
MTSLALAGLISQKTSDQKKNKSGRFAKREKYICFCECNTSSRTPYVVGGGNLNASAASVLMIFVAGLADGDSPIIDQRLNSIVLQNEA